MDFIAQNKLAAGAAPTARVEPRAVSDWLCSVGYGARTAYLGSVRTKIAVEAADTNLKQALLNGEAAAASATSASRMRALPDFERAELVAGLKARWDVLNNEYQRATKPISTSKSAIGEIRRKEQFESHLTEVEADLARLVAKGHLYIASM